MDKFLSRKRTFDDNKASTSAQTCIVPKIKSRKYSQEYLNFGFTITEVNGEEKPLCVICSKILAADSMKPNKLKRHFETLHARCKKPHTIAEELILPAAIEIVETMFGDNFAKELQSIPLSNDTVSRRIDDIAEDVEQQLFGKLRDKVFSIQLDEATDSNKDAHFIAWISKLRSGELSLQESVRSERESKIDNDVLRFMLENNPHLTRHKIEEEFGIHHATVGNHIKSIGFVLKRSVWVPHELTENNLSDRLRICSSLLIRHNVEPFLDKLIPEDEEKWILYENIKRKKSYCKPGTSSLTVPKPSIHQRKVLLCL
ncbi:histone-lysine N-methyltransferase SETMAR [Trichonephila clavipes]|nr:histone-lysine N-methyltransferase SETMAR [Trichonephila clavipes]